MKQFTSIFRILFLLLTLILTTQGQAKGEIGIEYYDSVEIGLITCSPHEEIYSLYGHSAIRVHNLHNGEDLVFNYGVFNYSQKFFVIRFVFGKTDYELGITSFKDFCRYYSKWGSKVSEQVLNLTNTEKVNVMHALAVNYLPQNRVYRYNFFYDNCATRPRDIIENNIAGKVVYPKPVIGKAPSFREMIHDYTQHHPWAMMGNDLLLGVRADMRTTQREQHFLPENLRYDFSLCQIQNPDGTTRLLVKSEETLVKPGVQLIEEDFPVSPKTCGIILLGISLPIFALEWKRKNTMVWWDVILMSVTGLAGIIVLVMFFSEHPTTSTNLQVLILNPIHLYYIPSVLRYKAKIHYWKILLVLVLLFYAGGFLQSYAEGMYFLALSLLLRSCSHLKHDK